MIEDYPSVEFFHTIPLLALTQFGRWSDILGEIAMENGEPAVAIAWFEKAVRIQDALPYTEPPFWYYPTRHTLGKAVLNIGRPAEAEIVYRRDLELYPRNCWAMQGLIQSLHEQDRNASDIQAKFDVIWAQADIT